MNLFVATERPTNTWERVLIFLFFASYAIACIRQESLMPALAVFFLALGAAIFYYLPLRLIYWLWKGDGEIQSRILINLPIIALTAIGILFAVGPRMS